MSQREQQLLAQFRDVAEDLLLETAYTVDDLCGIIEEIEEDL